ncbi:Ubiquinone/menaquinone biosynthesis C-methyltransferase UbiE [Rubripirellula lacrimiformis]|uniref:Ubiquinone/menaquinone biosynthesis C-methyltransferase UbiE n=1 Tax=Rubripirellula lacrimiformis TaxID=1930273 RepID=A0A517NAV6_9BACT|nr:class I SAM-dependent methyltransferase [Rubripirellula lacrimiformis]QDT04261.1 Ubiquinone/menaquinone biosynthesis C-methyltransferase UbiE [Rubripirellula lacrimiformis]
MGFYSRVVFPAFYDCVIDKPYWDEHRKRQLADVSGEILEIGVGTGLNLPHYPDHVRRITTVDPNPGMNRKLAKRIAASEIEVDRRMLSSEELPFDDETFDCVVSTITMCSIVNVDQALGELFRVLTPGGRFQFFEHGVCPDPAVQRRQVRWNWLQGMIGDGCRLDLDLAALLANQSFTTVEIDNFYMPQTPRTHGYMYRGIATK